MKLVTWHGELSKSSAIWFCFQGLEEIIHSQQALECLLESQDYAAALDLLDQMKGLLQNPSLLGLQCVRHLPPKIADTAVAVEVMLAGEFTAAVVYGEVARVVAEAASDAEGQPGRVKHS
jgi:hypothetical protein